MILFSRAYWLSILTDLYQRCSLFHEEDSSARLLFNCETGFLTWVIGMLGELCKPCICDKDALTLGIFLLDWVPLLLCLADHILHVLVLESTEDTKEKVSLWKLAWELFRGRQVLWEHRVCYCILIHVLNRELLIVRYLHKVHLVDFEMLFGFT